MSRAATGPLAGASHRGEARKSDARAGLLRREKGGYTPAKFDAPRARGTETNKRLHAAHAQGIHGFMDRT